MDDRDSKSHGGTHHVVPTVMIELDARSDARFICTILLLDDDSCEPPDLSR
jgi:hypothetical protein